MKKIILMLVVFWFPFKVFAISASGAVVMDLDNNRVLYGYNTNESRLIASTTKIMTAIIAIEYGDLDKEVKVTDIVGKSFGSGIYIKPGEVLTLGDLLYGLMLRSGNDAALMISEYVAGSTEEFVYLMNEYANKLEMKNTRFYNPHGLEEDSGLGNTSSPYDMAILTSYAMKNTTFRKIFATKSYTTKSNQKSYVWKNKNKLLKYDYVTGGKTGFTEKARRTLVTTGSKDGNDVVIVTLNDPNDWQDHTDLYNKVFNEYKNIKIISEDKFKLKDKKYYKKGQLFIKNDYYMSLKKEEIKDIELNMELMKYKNYEDDMLVGYIHVLLGNKEYHKEPIYVKKNKEKVKKTFWGKIKESISW